MGLGIALISVTFPLSPAPFPGGYRPASCGGLKAASSYACYPQEDQGYSDMTCTPFQRWAKQCPGQGEVKAREQQSHRKKIARA
jgi:hypothetical protein